MSRGPSFVGLSSFMLFLLVHLHLQQQQVHSYKLFKPLEQKDNPSKLQQDKFESSSVQFTAVRPTPTDGDTNDTNKNMTSLEGRVSARPGQYPFMVNIMLNETHVCGGAIIDDRHILSARHCFGFVPILENNYTIVVGDYNMTRKDGEQVVELDSIILHGGKHDDIALLRTSQPMGFVLTKSGYGSVDSIWLAHEDWSTRFGAHLTGVGWGQPDESSKNTSQPMEFEVNIIQCPEDLEDISERPGAFCEHPIARKGAGGRPCSGDSGGPLFVRLPSGQAGLVGIISGGTSFDCNSGAEFSTNVYHYLDWIKRHHLSSVGQSPGAVMGKTPVGSGGGGGAGGGGGGGGGSSPIHKTQ